ncbi:MAG TPA: hypothetical protein VEK34_01405 [Methylocella sp.]|nr:hypothetical protein [Methylocella sp.]
MSAKVFDRDQSAEHTAEAAIEAQARRAVISFIKRRARAYAAQPSALEAFSPDLASASPEMMMLRAGQLIDAGSRGRPRWIGFGGEVRLINAKALLLLARTRRRQLFRGAHHAKTPLNGRVAGW